MTDDPSSSRDRRPSSVVGRPSGERSEPRLTVLTAVHDGERFLAEAIDSILGQTLADFRYVIVDDGSTDGTRPIIEERARSDDRVEPVRLETRQGLARALNAGLERAVGDYLARQDADDVSATDRLEKQVAWLDAHPGVVIVGSAYRLIDESGEVIAEPGIPATDTEIRWQMLFHNAFAHSAVVARLDALRVAGLGYDPELEVAQDYALWSRLLEHGAGANLPERLLLRRVHPDQAGQRAGRRQRRAATGISVRNLERLGLEPDPDTVERLREWYNHAPRSLGRGDAAAGLAMLDAAIRFSRTPGVDRGTARRIRKSWVARLSRVLPLLPVGPRVSRLFLALARTSPLTLLRRWPPAALRRLLP